MYHSFTRVSGQVAFDLIGAQQDVVATRRNHGWHTSVHQTGVKNLHVQCVCARLFGDLVFITCHLQLQVQFQ